MDERGIELSFIESCGKGKLMKYIQEFKNDADILSQYSAPDDALSGAEVLLAWYGYGSYCGDSLVLFRKDGKLFEVHGSHCSCMGLEGQWEPEETTWTALAMRDLTGECEGSAEADAELKRLVAAHSETA